MKTFFSTLTSFVGAKQLAIALAFFGATAFLILPSRQKVADWSSRLPEGDRALPLDGSGVVNLEAPDVASPPSGVPSTGDASLSAHESEANSVNGNLPAKENESPVFAVSGDRSGARQTESSSSDDFGHSLRRDPLAEPTLGFGLGAWVGSSARLGGGGVSGAVSTGGGSPASHGKAQGNSGNSSNGQTRAADHASATDAARIEPLSDIVPDPSPVMQDPIPIARSSAPAPQDSPAGPNENVNAAPANAGEFDTPPIADYGMPNLDPAASGASGADEHLASLATNPLALPGLTDLPAETDPKNETLLAAAHVADSGHNLVLLGGAVLGVLGVHRRFRRRMAAS